MFGGDQRSGGGPDYELLPTADGKSTTRVSFGPSRWLKRRRNLAAFVLLVASAALVLFYLLFYQPPPEPVAVEEEGAEQPLPPLYREYRQAELELPQHDHKNPFADGRKYLWVADHVQCELCLCALIRRVLILASSIRMGELHARPADECRARIPFRTIVSFVNLRVRAR